MAVFCVELHIHNYARGARVWAGQLTHDYSFGIYFNRVAAANSPLEEGNRPNPKHTTSFQVILTAEGAVKMYVEWSSLLY